MLSQAGNYSFTISNPGGANGGLANSVTLTIYKADGKSKLKSITVKPKYDARTGTWTATAGSTGYFLMEAGTYYVAVGAPGGNKGENTDYSVKVDGTVFNHAKNGIANNTIDQAKALAGVKLGGNVDGTLTSTKVLEQEWVGYGDAVDYQKLVFQHAGSYTFTTSGLSGKVKLTVYSVDANGKQKSLKSITVNSGAGTIKDLLLEANTNYYIAVESTDAKKGASIDYEVSVGGKVFNHDKNGLANNSFDQARALPVLMTAAVTLLFGLGRAPGAGALFGMLVISVGCLLLPLRSLREFRLKSYLSPAVAAILIAAAGTTGYTVFDSMAVPYLENQAGAALFQSGAYLFGIESMIVIGLGFYVRSRPRERVAFRQLFLKSVYPPLCGLCASGCYVLILLSMRFVSNVSYIQAFRQLSLPFGVLAGIFLLREPRYPVKLCGIGMVILGLVLVSLL